MPPYGIDITMISGQKNAGEAVTLASAFLDMPYLSIIPVSTSTNIRDDFFLPLEIYLMRDHSIHYQLGYNKKLILPQNLSTSGLFWLALDKEGYSIAKSIVSENGLSPDEKVTGSIARVNLVTPLIPPYPDVAASSKSWSKIKNTLYQAQQQHQGVKSQEGLKKVFEKHVPVTPVEKTYFSWYTILRKSLAPWQTAIKNIVFD